MYEKEISILSGPYFFPRLILYFYFIVCMFSQSNVVIVHNVANIIMEVMTISREYGIPFLKFIVAGFFPFCCLPLHVLRNCT